MSRKSAYKSESGRELPVAAQQAMMMNEKERQEEETTEGSEDGKEDGDCIETIRSRAATIGIGIFIVAAILIVIGLVTPYWLESSRLEGTARFERLGLWTHCLRSLVDPFDPYVRRFTAGCKIILGLFSSEALEKRLPGLPAFFVAVQFMYVICFLFMLLSLILIPIYVMIACLSPYHKRRVLLIKLIGHFTLFSAFVGIIAVIVFGAKGNADAAPNQHQYVDLQNRFNVLSWSFGCACLGVILEAISGLFFEYEAILQSRG